VDDSLPEQALTCTASPALPLQQSLFSALDELEFFTSQQTAGATRYAKHTGTTAEKKSAVMEVAKKMLAAGCSQRDVAGVCQLGRETVRALVNRWETSGELEPLKRRMIAQLDDIGEEQLAVYRDALRAGKISATQIPVHYGIFADKRALLAGEATSRIEHVTREKSVNDILAEVIDVEASPVQGTDSETVQPRQISQ
jgi:transposase